MTPSAPPGSILRTVPHGDEIHHLLMMDTWHYETAMLLLFGVFRAEVSGEADYFWIEGRRYADDCDVGDMLKEVSRMTRLWLSNPAHGTHATPKEYFAWARVKGIKIYWYKLARSAGYFAEPLTEAVSVKDLTPREKSTQNKLIYGMAMAGYGYRASDQKSDAPKRIADDLAEFGISLSDDTVRKFLKLAAKDGEAPST